MPRQVSESFGGGGLLDVQSMPRHPSYDREPAYEPVRWRRWLALGGLLAIAAVVAVRGLVGDGWSTAPLPEAGQPAELALTGGGGGLQSALSVHITGEIDGVAEVWASNWEVEQLSGRVDWRVYHDWFLPDCILHYRPVGHVSGRLVVRYRFH